jgi:hypothetical protein
MPSCPISWRTPVSILSASRPLYGVSIVFAAAGAVMSVNGFLLLVHLPIG